jgi:PAS domain S-box-containing protein
MTQRFDYLAGGGEMGAMIGANDWSSTALGPMQDWPEVLHCTLHTVLNSKHPMFIWWGPDLLQFYNDAYRETLGPDRHPSALGQPGPKCWEEIWHMIGPEILSVMGGGPATWHKDRLVPITRDGRRQDVWWTYGYSPIGDRKGVHGVLVICNDITLQRRGQLRHRFLLELADQLKPLSSTEEIVSVATAKLGNYLDASRVMFSEVNESESTFLVRRDWTRKEFGHLAGKTGRLDEFGPDVIRALRAGETVAIEDVLVDPRTRHEERVYSTVDGRSSLFIPLVKDGQLMVVLGVHRAEPYTWTEDDIDSAADLAGRTWAAVENEQAQARLRDTRDHAGAVFDTMTEGFAILDHDWTILQMNAEGVRIMRMPVEDIVERSYWEAFPALKGTELEAVYERVRTSGTAEVVEWLYLYPDGTTAWTEIRVYPALDNGLAFFFRDVSHRKEVEQKLKDADRRKDEFLAMLAHELRNPLAPISSGAALLQRHDLDPAHVRKTSEIIGRQVKHMTSLVNDLMDVSRVTRGLVEIKTDKIDVKSIVALAIEQVRPLIEARRHRLAVDLVAAKAFVQGDHERLIQVIANLLNNAAKYTPEGGNIVLKVEVSPQEVAVSVTDNGIGMAGETVGRVFDLFSQAQRSSDRSLGGLGIGLALVKSLVELHQGSITAQSQGLDRGSVFVIRLPRVDARPVAGQSGPEDAIS